MALMGINQSMNAQRPGLTLDLGLALDYYLNLLSVKKRKVMYNKKPTSVQQVDHRRPDLYSDCRSRATGFPGYPPDILFSGFFFFFFFLW